MVAVFTCSFFYHFDDCNPNEVDEIETIFIAKSLHHVLITIEYRAYLGAICDIFDGYTRLY